MQLWVRRVVALAFTLILTTVVAGTASAQGVTSASVTGTITQDGGGPLEGANIVVTNTATGQRFQVATRVGGRFNIENLPPGGPYTIEVRAIGYQAGRRSGVRLELGQRYTSNFALQAAVVEVQEITVQNVTDPLINRGRTGSGSTVSAQAIQDLPSQNRNFQDLIATSPQVVSAPGARTVNIAGSNGRYNSIQIDGSVNNDLFGLGSTGAPGGQNNGRPISMDAVQEFQVLVAPFDVRQGGFTGGLVNAITRSGTNQYSGSAFFFMQNEALVSKTPEPEADEFSILNFGGVFGGPIIRDKVHFFFSAEKQKSTTPYGGLLVGVDFDTTNGQDYCDRFSAVIDSLGYDAGSCGAFDTENPNFNFFGKITAVTGPSGSLELSVNYAESDQNFFSRSSNGNYQLTGGFYDFSNTNVTPRLKWTNIFANRFNNELILGYARIRDRRSPVTQYSVAIVDAGAYNLVSGAEENSQANSLDQDIWELTDNLSWDLNEKHRLTVGTHNEFFGFTNVFFPRKIGKWTFNSIDSMEQGLANQYERQLTGAQAGIAGGRADGPISDFEVRQWGLYAQDQWTPSPNLTVTVGLRADIPIMPLTPPTNPRVDSIYGIDTGVFPSGNTLWSPRLGFNYDMGGRGDLIIRGGAGVFSGRPPYVWLSNAYGNSGLEQARLLCTGAANVPVFGNFGLDPENQPTTCRAGNTPGAVAPDINFFNEDFKFPQVLRFSLGFDKKLPWDMVASVDLGFSNTFKQMYINDVNLTGAWSDTGSKAALAGEGGRLMYGTLNDNGTQTNATVTPDKTSTSYGYVLGHWNRGRDYAYSAVFQLQKRMSNAVELNAGYTYSRSYDLISLTSSVALSNYGFAPVDGSLGDRNLRPSLFDRPHSVKLSGIVHLPYNFDFALSYVGVSGSPYAYVINGDANADGVGIGTQKNDLFYVPLDSTDISWTNTLSAAARTAKWDSLNAYIEQDPCLKDQRGKLMQRTSCRNPWLQSVNASFSWSVATYRGQRLELRADIFNVAHLLNEEWGVQKLTSFNETTNIVRKTGTDAANQRSRYDLALPVYQAVQRNDSRSRFQLGGRYTF
jgi:hypothetical protein